VVELSVRTNVTATTTEEAAATRVAAGTRHRRLLCASPCSLWLCVEKRQPQ